MKNLFKLFILLNAILISIHGSCPDYPTIPATSPKLITSVSPGISNFPSSTQQFSLTMSITPKETCITASNINLFSINFGATSDSWTLGYDCSSLYFTTTSSWLGTTTMFSPFSSSALGPMGIFFSFDVMTQEMKVAIHSDTDGSYLSGSSGSPSNLYFDANSQFYLCADKDGTSPQDCTISELIFEYRYYSDFPSHLAGPDPAIAAFYPLAYGSLATSTGSAASAYFGDKKSNPKTGTSPTWDSSNAFITLKSGQFLTIPLPDISYPTFRVSSSFSFAAWVKITNIPSTTATIFAMYSADGTQVGFQLAVSQSTKEIKLAYGSSSITFYDTVPTATLNQWQLIGFSAYWYSNSKAIDGTVFVGTLSAIFGFDSSTAMDPSTLSVIRIGDKTSSISGQVSAVRVMTPGEGIVRTTDLCSSDNSIELGVGSFPLACSGTNFLNADECVATCPSDLALTSETAVPLCVTCPKRTYFDSPICQACPDNCAECDANECKICDDGYQLNTKKECVLKPSITKEKSGLSGGAIAGIACGCIIILLVILILGGRYFKKKTLSKGASKTKPHDTEARPISPITSEANPLMP